VILSPLEKASKQFGQCKTHIFNVVPLICCTEVHSVFSWRCTDLVFLVCGWQEM